MKKIILAMIICSPMKLFSTTYYVANSGSDLNNGTTENSPWKTISKVNKSQFTPGDKILFKKGDVWSGNTIDVQQSGTINNPITWSSYGSGENPIISGFVTTSGWINTGNGIWTYSDDSLPSNINVLTIDGKPQAFGRFPKSGYNTYTESDGSNSITDLSLNASDSYVGGELVIRKSHWLLTRGTITSQSAGKMTYDGSGNYQQNAMNGFGYFIQNHLKCLTTFGDWCYDASTHKISFYFGSTLPDEHTIKVSNQNLLISFLSSHKNNTFIGLTFEGGNDYAINGNYGSDSNQVIDCVFNAIGISAIYFPGASNQLFSGNKFSNCLNNAITVFGSGNTIIENIIDNTAMLPGMGQSSDGINGAGSYTAILAGYNNSENTVIRFNKITNTGYDAINVNGNAFVVDKNFVDTFCMVLDDGGGIYTYTGNTPISYSKERIITNNIILNGVGAPEGTTGSNQANGIYADDESSDLLINYNSVANCGQYGYFLHNNHEITFTGNLGYDNKKSQLAIGHDDLGISLPKNFNISKNKFITNSTSQLCLYFYSLATNSSSSDLTTNGIIDSNYYSTLNLNTVLFSSQIANTQSINWNFLDWQNISYHDKNSTLHQPLYVSKLFAYNATKLEQDMPLSGTYQNAIDNVNFCNLNLNPYSSEVLLLQKSGTAVFNKPTIVINQ